MGVTLILYDRDVALTFLLRSFSMSLIQNEKLDVLSTFYDERYGLLRLSIESV